MEVVLAAFVDDPHIAVPDRVVVREHAIDLGVPKMRDTPRSQYTRHIGQPCDRQASAF
jgi:hypothetical protein